LSAEKWDHRFQVRLSLQAIKLYRKLYGDDPPKVRDPLWSSDRNMVCQYPCGILEQAYRELKERERSMADASED
jgi:hypothetical protein